MAVTINRKYFYIQYSPTAPPKQSTRCSLPSTNWIFIPNGATVSPSILFPLSVSVRRHSKIIFIFKTALISKREPSNKAMSFRISGDNWWESTAPLFWRSELVKTGGKYGNRCPIMQTSTMCPCQSHEGVQGEMMYKSTSGQLQVPAVLPPVATAWMHRWSGCFGEERKLFRACWDANSDL